MFYSQNYSGDEKHNELAELVQCSKLICLPIGDLGDDRSSLQGNNAVIVSEIYGSDLTTRYRLPVQQHYISAGFPSPAEDYIDNKLDLNRYLIKNPATTFYVKVSGSSMMGVGIHNGDLLIVDRSIEAISGRIVIAVLNGELTVKRLCCEGDRLYLKAENSSYPPIEVTEPQELSIWGVVTSAIHLL
jgi:DNA polymerase V